MADRETNKKKLESYIERYEYFTGKSSEINRSLALGGIAIIWIFKTTTITGGSSIPNQLIIPLIWLVLTLGLDLLHYISGGVIWLGYYKYVQKKIDKDITTLDSEINPPSILPIILHIFYWGKITSTIIAYYLLIAFLYMKFIADLVN
jgi:hypothetical protein